MSPFPTPKPGLLLLLLLLWKFWVEGCERRVSKIRGKQKFQFSGSGKTHDSTCVTGMILLGIAWARRVKQGPFGSGEIVPRPGIEYTRQ